MTVLPLCPFPNIQWLSAYLRADSPLIDLGEHYVKQSYRNRFDVLGSHGVLPLTVRVVGQHGQKIAMPHIKLVDDEWRRVALRGIVASYSRAPFFDEYIDELEGLLLDQTASLTDWSLRTLTWAFERLEWNAEPRVSRTYIEPAAALTDLRGAFKSKQRAAFGVPYAQVFEDRFGFVPNLSVIDLLMNTGPAALEHLDLHS
jgi:hypothetical protein